MSWKNHNVEGGEIMTQTDAGNENEPLHRIQSVRDYYFLKLNNHAVPIYSLLKE